MTTVSNTPKPANEPVLDYAPGSAARATLKSALATTVGEVAEIPGFVGGRELRSEAIVQVTAPHRHRHVLGRL